MKTSIAKVAEENGIHKSALTNFVNHLSERNQLPDYVSKNKDGKWEIEDKNIDHFLRSDFI